MPTLFNPGRQGCVCCQAENELRNWTHQTPEPAPCDERLGTQYCRSRLPDKWPRNGLVTSIPRCWFPAWSLCIQVLVCTFSSFNAHPLVPGSPTPAASEPLPKTSNSVLISELGLGEEAGCLHRKDRESVSPVGAGGHGEKVRGNSGLQPHFTYTPWLFKPMRTRPGGSAAGLSFPLCPHHGPCPPSSWLWK